MTLRRVLSTALGCLLVVSLVSLLSCRRESRPAAAKILLVSIDTTRADHVSAYGYERPTTPALAALAERGVRFVRAYAPMPTTDPSHATMLTGQYPRTHGIMRNAARRRDPGAPSLATWLADRGFTTAAITARLGLDPPLRGIRGFEHADAPVLPDKWRDARDIVKRVRRWLRAREPDERWFLWAHLWEPHKPYDPPPPLRGRFVDSGRVPAAASNPPRFVKAGRPVPEAIVQAARSLYDVEIRVADDALAAIVDAAREAEPRGVEPLIVVVSDHGESLAERQREHGIAFGHGTLLYEEVVRVPWIVVWPEVVPAAVLETAVSLVDLAPTIAGLVAPGAALEAAEGRDLSPYLVRGADPPPRPIVLERRIFRSRVLARLSWPELGWIAWPYKLIVNTGLPAPELYRIDVDPGEEHDRAAVEPERVRTLQAALEQWVRAHPMPEDRGVSTREREALRSLGYLD